jgi:hypothetical protein
MTTSSFKNKLVSNIGVVSASSDTTITGNLIADGKTIDAIELSRLDGLTGAIQPQLDLKANQATTYTKTETDSRIQAVVGAAPAALDTLVEIATQLANDESAVTALTTTVSLKAPLASPTFTGTVSGITKAMVGLGSVDNTSDAAKPVSTAQQTALNLKAPTANPVFTGTQTVVALRETPVAIAASAIDMSLGTLFTKTITAATTFTTSNVPATGLVCAFTLELTNGGSSAITWWTGIKWTGGTAPTLTSAGVDILGFYTRDGGTTWRGFVSSKDSK